ncbi:peroxiredoxin [Marinospirillum alkaliphilum]|uniref:Glutathione-dependent peroxiredoxin n=1 Tax=Marinospirillum alkaliphilum DSM 21637 TaxID=1122209 RepID=A0A1K1YPA6_9GAMM|nr:peroxiredoxin [Marinospirillum alkaliphilum]SFX63656.1 Peroxiredoxin [Marinospirillum alkaliphilum DSM 21637]
MTIQVGDQLPNVELRIMGEKGPEPVQTGDLFKGKKVVLFALPGAFTPGCTMTHLPGYVVNADKIKAKGVDSIICLSVNDAFVMDAWGKSQNAEAIIMLADGIGAFTSAVGLELDLTDIQFGKRSKRYAMIINDGKLELLNIDEKGVDLSSAETLLAAL